MRDYMIRTKLKAFIEAIISSVQGNTFVITHDDQDRDTDDGTSTIMVPAGFDMTTLHIGERVYVAGKLIRAVVYSYGIQEFTTDRR